MPFNRREFLSLAPGGVATSLLAAKASAEVRPKTEIKAIAFDAFPIFDPRPVFARAEELFPGRGADLSNAWRTRQFEYAWLRTLSHRYADFWEVTQDSLIYAAKSLKLDLSAAQRDRLMEAYLEIRAWPDALPALKTLQAAGVRLAFLSNFTSKMLAEGIRNAGMEGMFEHLLSADRAHAHKPDPRAYRLGVEAFKLKREEILFAAFAGWDVAGAKWFGYPTFWVNRLKQPGEELGVTPDAVGSDLEALVRFVKAS